MLGHPGFSKWTYDSSDPEKSPDEVLDDITLYWLTNTATSSARLYWENGGRSPAVAASAEDRRDLAAGGHHGLSRTRVYRAPETWARRAYRNLIYFHEVDKGGHFAAWEQPELFCRRAARGVQTRCAKRTRRLRRRALCSAALAAHRHAGSLVHQGAMDVVSSDHLSRNATCYVGNCGSRQPDPDTACRGTRRTAARRPLTPAQRPETPRSVRSASTFRRGTRRSPPAHRDDHAWPEKETVTDQSQGVPLATMQELARYWATDYDWRKVRGEAERLAAVHHRDRRAGHSFHSRSFEA